MLYKSPGSRALNILAMGDQGDIRTCFLTARLPRWAGVRHNVTGSNISGLPVPSPETFSTGSSFGEATVLTLRNGATRQPDRLDLLMEQNIQLIAKLAETTARLDRLEMEVLDLKNELDDAHNAIVP